MGDPPAPAAEARGRPSVNTVPRERRSTAQVAERPARARLRDHARVASPTSATRSSGASSTPPTTASRRSVGASSSSVASGEPTAIRTSSSIRTGVLARALAASTQGTVRLDTRARSTGTSRSSATLSISARSGRRSGTRASCVSAQEAASAAVWTTDVRPAWVGEREVLADILETSRRMSPRSSSSTATISTKWRFLKGAKSLTRISRATGLEYTYDEGSIPFPDPIDGPSRTILTGEGGATPSRFKHLIQTEDGRFRRLTPRELERLDGFPGDWTAGMSDGKRAFMMGNALVVGLVEHIADELIKEMVRCPRSSPERAAASSSMAGLQLTEPATDSSPAVRNVMRANRARDTGPERRLRRGASGRPVSAAIASTGERLRVARTSLIPAAGWRSSSMAVTGTTARVATRTYRSRTRISGLGSSSSTGNEMPENAPT